jgi:hypothetical protein
LISTIFHLRLARFVGESRRIEPALRRAAAEVAASDLPDQVSTVRPVVAADAAFASVVREAAVERAPVKRQDRIGRQSAEAHRRDVEQRGRIGHTAARATHLHAKIVRLHRRWDHRVGDPLVAGRVEVELSAVRNLVQLVLGALVHDAALIAGERPRLGVAFDDVLAQLRPDKLEEKRRLPRIG